MNTDIPNLREITDKASEAALIELKKTQEFSTAMVLTPVCERADLGSEDFESDRPAREAFARSVWEQCMAQKASPLTEFQREVTAWAQATFPHQTPISKITHLAKEVQELLESPMDGEETADCFILLLNLADMQGIDIMEEARKKMVKNKVRKWGAPDAQGVCHHIEPAANAFSAAIERERQLRSVKPEQPDKCPVGPQLPAVVRKMAEDIGWGSKEPQPPDWVVDPLTAMECSKSCLNFINAVARIKELEAEVERMEQARARCSAELIKTQNEADEEQTALADKLAAAEKRVAELEESSPWIPISERLPTKKDADEAESVAVTDGKAIWLFHVDLSPSAHMTHWMPFVPPKQPTPEEQSRAEFEAEWAKEALHIEHAHGPRIKNLAFRFYQAARKEKL